MTLDQSPLQRFQTSLIVRASSPKVVRGDLQRAVQATRPDLPYVEVRLLEDLVAPELRPWRLGARMFGLLGALALIVAAVGMYSVRQFTMSQRREEVSIRVALGARRPRLFRSSCAKRSSYRWCPAWPAVCS
jgi:hypothetical protein